MSRAGSIKRDASGQWAFVVDLAPAGAPRRQVRRRGFATKKDAQEALDLLKGHVRDGTYVERRRDSFGGYLADWLDGLAAQGRKASTIAGYREKVGSYVMAHDVAHVPLQALTAVDLDAFYGWMATGAGRQGKGVSPRTRRYVHTIVAKALADAERKGIVVRNVARLASPPSTTAARAPEPDVWSPGELARFLDSVADHHHGPLFHVAAMTGMRRGELVGLRWSDVDLDAGKLRVAQSITIVVEPVKDPEPGQPRTARRLVTGTVKSARSRRTIDLDPDTVAVLRTHRKAAAAQRLQMGAGFTDHGLVFCTKEGGPWSPETITQAFDRAVARSKVKRMKLHGLRHAHATHLLAAGVNPRIVSERLGHSSVSFTLDVYAHVLDGQQADAAAAVAALVKAARG